MKNLLIVLMCVNVMTAMDQATKTSLHRILDARASQKAIHYLKTAVNDAAKNQAVGQATLKHNVSGPRAPLLNTVTAGKKKLSAPEIPHVSDDIITTAFGLYKKKYPDFQVDAFSQVLQQQIAKGVNGLLTDILEQEDQQADIVWYDHEISRLLCAWHENTLPKNVESIVDEFALWLLKSGIHLQLARKQNFQLRSRL